MKAITLFILGFLSLSVSTQGQNSVDSIMSAIEKNNNTLEAVRQEKEAQLIGNRTHLYPENPQVEFNYLWGNNSLVDDRKDFTVTQSFDFPSAYVHKNHIARARNAQSEINYLEKRREILLEARLLIIDLIYSNVRLSNLRQRLVHAQNIESAVKLKSEKGESNILDWNKAKLSLLTLQKVYEMAEIDRQNYLAELARLNGGKNVQLADTVFKTIVIPSDFENWYLQVRQNIPYRLFLDQEIEISMNQEKLAMAMSLPRFFAGYMSENTTGNRLQGITAGITIPLWENKNTVKYNQVRTIAYQSQASDVEKQYYNMIKTRYDKAVLLQKTLSDYKLTLESMNNSQLLWKAYELGEISLIEYMLELSVYYESIDMMLETEMELNKTMTLMSQFD
jgi:outer membrane protein, heavy metal efflux system